MLSFAGKFDEAAAALERYERKGNVVMAGRMRERLAKPRKGVAADSVGQR